MNDRYRNVCKAHDHIVKCREKERTKVFIPYWGYVFIPSNALLMARIRRDAYKYIGDNVRTIRHRMRKLKGYNCTVRD